eukprot:scaffold14882_cov80-Cyclotella_meneghiniana.AAC.7
MQLKNSIAALITSYSLTGAVAFIPIPHQSTRPVSSSILRQNNFDGPAFGGDGTGGGYEEVEFTIHADGRITEVVRGVRGPNCQKATKSINEKLGIVTNTEATEEMFEQELVVDQTVTQDVDGGWDGATSW